MITIFNRRELTITMDMNRLSEIRRILESNKIDYTLITTNLQSSSLMGSSRSRMGSTGINPIQTYEYKIFVHKDDHKKALHLIL